jgi:hypothetical protein
MTFYIIIYVRMYSMYVLFIGFSEKTVERLIYKVQKERSPMRKVSLKQICLFLIGPLGYLFYLMFQNRNVYLQSEFKFHK